MGSIFRPGRRGTGNHPCNGKYGYIPEHGIGFAPSPCSRRLRRQPILPRGGPRERSPSIIVLVGREEHMRQHLWNLAGAPATPGTPGSGTATGIGATTLRPGTTGSSSAIQPDLGQTPTLPGTTASPQLPGNNTVPGQTQTGGSPTQTSAGGAPTRPGMG